MARPGNIGGPSRSNDRGDFAVGQLAYIQNQSQLDATLADGGSKNNQVVTMPVFAGVIDGDKRNTATIRLTNFNIAENLGNYEADPEDPNASKINQNLKDNGVTHDVSTKAFNNFADSMARLFPGKQDADENEKAEYLKEIKDYMSNGTYDESKNTQNMANAYVIPQATKVSVVMDMNSIGNTVKENRDKADLERGDGRKSNKGNKLPIEIFQTASVSDKDGEDFKAVASSGKPAVERAMTEIAKVYGMMQFPTAGAKEVKDGAKPKDLADKYFVSPDLIAATADAKSAYFNDAMKELKGALKDGKLAETYGDFNGAKGNDAPFKTTLVASNEKRVVSAAKALSVDEITDKSGNVSYAIKIDDKIDKNAKADAINAARTLVNIAGNRATSNFTHDYGIAFNPTADKAAKNSVAHMDKMNAIGEFVTDPKTNENGFVRKVGFSAYAVEPFGVQGGNTLAVQPQPTLKMDAFPGQISLLNCIVRDRGQYTDDLVKDIYGKDNLKAIADKVNSYDSSRVVAPDIVKGYSNDGKDVSKSKDKQAGE